VLMLLGLGAVLFAVTKRTPFEANLLRARGSAYAIEGERVHNVFDLHLTNKQPDRRVFRIEVVGPEGAEVIVAMREVPLESLGDMRVPVHVYVPKAIWKAGLRCELSVKCEDPSGEIVRLATAPLLGPSAAR